MIELNNINYYSLVEVSEKLKLTNTTLRKYLKSGKLKSIKHGNKYYISDVELNNYLNNLTTPPETKE